MKMEAPNQPASRAEAEPPLVVVPPASESLLNPSAPGSLWPAEVLADPRLEREAAKRRELIASLDEVEAAVPDPTTELAAAVARGALAPDRAAALYERLAAVLEDPAAERLALYVPLEYLPPADWRPSSGGLSAAADRFAAAYMVRWRELLTLGEDRGRFVDGDTPDGEEAGERVVKAAHLIPALVAKGMFDPAESVELARRNTGKTIAASIVDALPMLIDSGHLGAQDEADARRMVAERGEATRADRAGTESRAAWLGREARWAKRREAVSRLADRLASGASSGELLRATASADAESATVAVEAVGAAAEKLAANDDAAARKLVSLSENLLADLATAFPEAADALAGVWSKVRALGLSEASSVAGYDVHVPKLDGSFAENRALIEGDLERVGVAVRDIARNPELAAIYPVALGFGSRFKGYGSHDSDADYGVFVRPGTDVADRARLAKLVGQTFAGCGVDAKPIQFWLEGMGGKLRVRDLSEAEPNVASSRWAQPLFHGAWQGERGAIEELHAKLLPGYLHPRNPGEREAWLMDEERGALVYRLMHRGYAKFFPRRGGLGKGAPASLDPESAFWDSGYRRLAMKLYAQKVFLPNLG